MNNQSPDIETAASQPTSAPRDPRHFAPSAARSGEHVGGASRWEREFEAWPGFPFPPPLMGLSWQTVHAAAAHWLRMVADLLEGGDMNLNVLFAAGPTALTCEAFGLPTENAGRVVTAAALYTVGALSPQPTLTALFAAPEGLHPARLRQAADALDA